MKKVLAICLMMVMVVSMSVTAFAAPGGFVSSPSGNPAPTVVDFDPENDECTAKLVIIPHAERNTLPDDLKALIENAYTSIAESNDLTKLNADLASLVASKNISADKLAVSDLFDAHITGCDMHEGHVNFDITLKADTLKRFVGLLHMNKNGEWELVADAKITNDGEYLEFSIDSFSPFAIVVDTTVDGGDAPQTYDNSMIHIYAIIMAVSALAVIVIAVKSKKRRV